MHQLVEVEFVLGVPSDVLCRLWARVVEGLRADDSGIWERDLFTRFLEERTNSDGSDLGGQLAILFQTLNQPLSDRQTTYDEILTRFPYVNGGIFDGRLEVLSGTSLIRDRLLEACGFNWASISPAIFGNLFQAVKDPRARRELGEHYTSEANILKTINPLFMDDLNNRFERNWSSVPGPDGQMLFLSHVVHKLKTKGCMNASPVRRASSYAQKKSSALHAPEKLAPRVSPSHLQAVSMTRMQVTMTVTGRRWHPHGAGNIASKKEQEWQT